MSLERMTALLKRAGMDLETGARTLSVAEIVEEDKRQNWPAIQAEMDRRNA